MAREIEELVSDFTLKTTGARTLGFQNKILFTKTYPIKEVPEIDEIIAVLKG